MAKITAVIDIGSNSARMAVFKKTSHFGFVLLKEIKSRVRISEGAYENNGNNSKNYFK
jgi:exopolyphosphatase/guanosine-5'-triphosphate,3'-diphosphate pyrophosphatase